MGSHSIRVLLHVGVESVSFSLQAGGLICLHCFGRAVSGALVKSISGKDPLVSRHCLNLVDN